MYRRGHIGVTMLAYAPVAHLLLQRGEVGLALLGFLGVYLVEPLPDKDFQIPFLRHRGTSHSLFSALVIGTVLGAVGWVVGGQLPVLSAGTLAGFGFAVGVAGIIAHLLGDVITDSGIQPFLPISKRRVSLSPVNADNTIANSALFGLGILALVVILFAAVPAGLSPVGIAAGQSANQSTNQTNGNQTAASVELDSTNNTTAKTVVVSKVRLPEGGFVAVHGVAYERRGVLRDSAITVSNHLSPGVHRNVSIPVKRGVPGIISNQTRLSYTRPNLSIIVYQDTNNNTQYDFVTSFGSNDTPYQTSGGEPVADTETVVLETNVQQVNQRTQTTPARIRFEDQQLRHVGGNPVLTIQNATLPRGGFVVIHDGRYLGPTRDPLSSAIGVSTYLSPGVHRNVTVPLLNGSVTSTQTLVAVPYLDTDGDQTYDFVTTGGEVDYAYIGQQNGSTAITNDTATVSVEATGGTFGGTATPTATTTTTTPIDTATPFRVTNLSVSNRTAHVGDEITVTAWIENPTQHRLTDDLAVATAGEVIETKPAALFPRERRAVKFRYTYGAPGTFVIKVGNQTEQIHIVPEGAPLTTVNANGSQSKAGAVGAQSQGQSQSGGGWGSLLWIAVGAIVLGFIGVVAVVILNRT